VQSQEFNWATHVSGEEYEYGLNAIKDRQENTYMIGYSTGNPLEHNGVTHPASGRGDAFFAKLDIDKELIWMKSIGGNDSNYFYEALNMHMDPFGDIYLTFKLSGNNFTYNGQILSGINSPGTAGSQTRHRIQGNKEPRLDYLNIFTKVPKFLVSTFEIEKIETKK
jgi:hypothetical protein